MGNEVQQLNNLYAQINMMSGNQLGSTSFANGATFNDAAWFLNAVQGLGSASSPEQKAAIGQGLIQQALSIFSKLANNEAKAAEKEVTAETKKANELVANSEKLGVRVEGQFSEIASDVDEQTKIVQEATEQIGKTQKSLEEKQKQVEKLVSQIEEKQRELTNAKPEDQAAILNEIQGLATKIADIGVTIEEDNESLQTLTNSVENSSKNIDEAFQQMTVVEQDGIGQIQQLSQTAAGNVAEVTKTGTTGATNQATSVSAEAAANAASSNIFTGASVAPKLQRLAQDQGAAANARLSSIAGNINRISQGIGGLTNSSSIISSFKNSIGSSIDNYATQIGSWNTAVEPVITSIGSFGSLATGVEELSQAVETDLTTINPTNNDKENTEISDNEEKEEEITNNPTELQTPQFDTKKLRTFGI